MPNPVVNRRVILSGVGYPSYIQQLFSRWTNAVPLQYKTAMATFINQCIADGNWQEMDACWMPAQYDETNALQQLKSSSFTLSRVNSPEWLSGVGWKPNGTTQYLITGFTPSTNGVKLSLNSESIGIYSNTNIAEDKVDFGGANGNPFTFLYSRNTSDMIVSSINDDAGNAGNAITNSVGLMSAKKSNSTQIVSYIRGSAQAAQNSNSSSVTAFEQYLNAYNNNGTAAFFSTKRLCFAFIGSKDIDHSLLNTAVKNYLRTIWLLDADVSYWYTSRPTQPSIEELGIMYEFIKGIKVDNSYSSFSQAGDLMYIYGSATEDNAMKNVFNKAFDVIKVNSPTWTANQGYTGDGTTKYLRFGYVPSTNGDVCNQNNAAVVVYNRTNVTEASFDGGAVYTNGTLRYYGVLASFGIGLLYGVINDDGGFGVPAVTVPTSVGLSVGSRKVSTAQEGWKNGVLLYTDPQTSKGNCDIEIYGLGANSNGSFGSGSTRQQGFFALLDGNIDHLSFYNRFTRMRAYYGF